MNKEPRQMEVEDKLGFIQRMIGSGNYDVAVKESCTLFEVVLKRIVQQAIVSLPYKDRDNLLEVERKIGKSIKGVQDFGFGELVGLFRESKLMDKWAKYTGKDLGLIATLDYASIVNLRNRITHDGATCTQGEANLVYEYLRNLLAVLGFADLESSVNESFKRKEPTGAAAGMAPDDTGSLLDRLPPVRKTVSQKSVYTSSHASERQRLRVQANNVRPFDMRAIEAVLQTLERPTDLSVLDVGCAAGTVTADRFGAFDAFSRVIGIDFNGDKIEEARRQDYGDRFAFRELDIENPAFEEQMAAIMEEAGIEGFDVVFSALTLHHLSNPVKALFKLRKLLKPEGFIVLRGSDDGSKLGYPDEQNLVQSLIRLTLEAEGVSDRENGRKLYYQLRKAGFKDIGMQYNVKDTVGLSLEERLALFEESFSYRKNYFKRRIDEHPGDPNVEQEYKWVCDALEELEMVFASDMFYYHEISYVAIARK